jgi:hypothetical protein
VPGMRVCKWGLQVPVTIFVTPQVT